MMDGQVLPELRLTLLQVDALEKEAFKSAGLRGLLLVGLIGKRGWRIGTVIGHKQTAHWKHRVKVPSADGTFTFREELATKVYELPGIRKEDVGENMIAIHGKRKHIKWEVVPEPYMTMAKQLAASTKPGEKLIPWTERKVWDWLPRVAEAAGVPFGKRLHSHRLRHFFGTNTARKVGRDPWKVASLMGQKSTKSADTYVAELTPEEEQEFFAIPESLSHSETVDTPVDTVVDTAVDTGVPPAPPAPTMVKVKPPSTGKSCYLHPECREEPTVPWYDMWFCGAHGPPGEMVKPVLRADGSWEDKG